MTLKRKDDKPETEVISRYSERLTYYKKRWLPRTARLLAYDVSKEFSNTNLIKLQGIKINSIYQNAKELILLLGVLI